MTRNYFLHAYTPKVTFHDNSELRASGDVPIYLQNGGLFKAVGGGLAHYHGKSVVLSWYRQTIVKNLSYLIISTIKYEREKVQTKFLHWLHYRTTYIQDCYVIRSKRASIQTVWSVMLVIAKFSAPVHGQWMNEWTWMHVSRGIEMSEYAWIIRPYYYRLFC